MTGTQIVSPYAYHKPKGMHWTPRPLALAKRHPLRPIAERTSVRSSQPVVKVQDEHHVETVVEPEADGIVEGEVEGQPESSSLGDPNSPAASSGVLPTIHVGVSPEDFLRNALPSTYTFAPSSPPADPRLGISPPHRLRPSSSMSNISSASNKSRPPSVISTHQLRRSSSRLSDPRAVTSSPSATSS
ncbi:hypothetical protein RhiLY_02809 [Ceratobasidium sp. AG-Ba]|nr:hypothetical protein RhiLY_02809 [Ceratobasidium sp. AG-Ba]